MQGSRRVPLGLAHPGRVFIATALVALAVDQAAKAVVRALMVPQQSEHVIPWVLNLTYVQNSGAAFGLFPGRQPVFMVTSTLVLVVIAAYWWKVRPAQWPVVVALGLVTAGAVGNLIDRAFIGRVTDFFEFGFIDFPVFNVADMCILFGVVILSAWIIFGPEADDAVLGVADGDAAVADVGDAEKDADRDPGRESATEDDTPAGPVEASGPALSVERGSPDTASAAEGRAS